MNGRKRNRRDKQQACPCGHWSELVKRTDSHSRPPAVQHTAASFRLALLRVEQYRKLLIWESFLRRFRSRKRATAIHCQHGRHGRMICRTTFATLEIDPLAAKSGEAVINSVDSRLHYAVPRFLIASRVFAAIVSRPPSSTSSSWPSTSIFSAQPDRAISPSV
jgi:hypothetical protein